MVMLKVSIDGVSADIQIKTAAERTAEHVLASLPLDIPLVHATRSGNCAIAKAPQLADPSLPIEAQVSMYYPDMVAFDPTRGHLVFAYGQGQARTSTGTHWVTHFGTIQNGEDLAAKLQSTRDVGATTIRIEKIEKGA